MPPAAAIAHPSQSERSDMNNFVDRKVYYAGDIIFREGSQGDCAYLIERGEVRVYKGPPDAEVTLAVIRSGALLGEMAMIDSEPRMASAIAITETSMTMVSRTMFERKMETADPFLRALLRVLTRTLRDVSKRIPAKSEPPAPPK
jgi:CRP/FNR family cyclic AMP-dependent transcriptional regulator